MSKHTPGPWTVINGRHFYDDAFGVEAGESGFLIAPQTAMTEANARLIAAAPDLLEALERLMNGTTDLQDAMEANKQARAAIIKARGEG